jgi:hypothetical protein
MMDSQGHAGYFRTASSESWTELATGGVSAGDLSEAVNGLVSTNDLSDFVSMNDLSNYATNYDVSTALIPYISYHALPSAAAEYGLASTGYVTAAVANAGGGGSFDPLDYEEDGYENARIAFMNDSGVLGYYSGGPSTFSPIENYV